MNSEDPIPRLAVRLILTGLAAWGLAAVYTLHGNPEIRHFKRTDAIKHEWSEKMSREHGPKIVVYGGSSCEFSIDGERLLERFQLPCVNLGRGAGMGAVVLTMAALEEIRPGDTLIVALEPALLTDPLELPSLGVQFAVAVGHADWLRDPLPPADPLGRAGIALALRPGGLHTFTMLAKAVRGQELYRYKPEDMRPSGFNQTPVRVPISGPPGHRIHIPDSTMAFLRSLAAWCTASGVRLGYSIPWGYTPEDQLAAARLDNVRFLRQIARVMPVLKDSKLGAYAVREQFADTAWHLDEAGSALRTDEFGAQIKAWNIWSAQELEDWTP